ncbi:C-type lectin receptor-like tyrosine-protein kinase At1g52310 isoform X1 [Selaginella moellendorffii]|nr:C-type lectin receptor-like tyrosine-protein kinase At1g52310 isoform X1 [Selaginella moellendorffii]|eukprot:XP_024527126.1 C-type lectin receptor-like tyrosine-protein kinase At1g52310 isoform X1 [Selaginella moellendorffii]
MLGGLALLLEAAGNDEDQVERDGGGDGAWCVKHHHGDPRIMDEVQRGTRWRRIFLSLVVSAGAGIVLLFIAFGIIVSAAGQRRHQRSSSGQGRLSLLEEKQNSFVATCPDGWLRGPADRCFMLVNASSTWEESETSCRNRSGHLASITSDAEVAFVKSHCTGVFDPCWVGAVISNTSRGVLWRWSDCHVRWNFSFASSNCSSSGCVNLGEYCLSVSSMHGLVRENCGDRHRFVCVLATKEGECIRATNRKAYLIVLIAVSCLILVTALAIVIWLLVYRRKRRRRRSRRAPSSSMVPLSSLRLFTLDELRIATNNFGMENRLRGSTFKGILSDGVLVAVKKLERSSFQSRKEFLAEMNRIARLRHPSLVAVIGCCYDHGERYIAYEYIANGPLDLWLHDPVRRGTLDWRTRMQIAVTAAQGIAYLHDQVKPHVIHRDIKASSILLDDKFHGRVMGVGLASVVPWEAAYERTVVAGTHGYLAPEFVYRNELTTKSDVYSFGVLMLELISGRKPAMPVDVVDWQTIFEWATPLVQSQQLQEIIDPSLTSIPAPAHIQMLVDLIYSCTQHVASMRPRMSYVVHQLDQLKDVESLQPRQQQQQQIQEVVYPARDARSKEPALITVQSEIMESLF